MLGAEQLAVERVDRVGQLAMAVPAGRPGSDLVERDRDDAGRQCRERLGPGDLTAQVEDRHPRRDPVLGVERRRDRLEAVDGGSQRSVMLGTGQESFEERSAEALALRRPAG